MVYVLVFFAGVSSAFEGPARQTMIPALVPRRLFARAMTFNSTLQSLSAVTGPAIGGALIALQGVGLGYAAAWPVVVKVFEAKWSVDWAGLAVLLGGASGMAALGGVLAAFQALSKRPAPALRSE